MKETFAFVDCKKKIIKLGLSKEEVANEVLRKKWNMNYYIDIFQDEEGGPWILGGDRACDPRVGIDMEGFRLYEANTKDEVLDEVIRPRLNKTIFSEKVGSPEFIVVFDLAKQTLSVTKKVPVLSLLEQLRIKRRGQILREVNVEG